MLSISIDKANQKLMSLDVSTYIDDPDKKVVFNVTYKDVPDGTQYANSTTLDAQAKNLKIVIVNSGYKKGNGKWIVSTIVLNAKSTCHTLLRCISATALV